MKRFMTTKMAMSVLVITVAMAMVGMGTFAYFSDNATSSGNNFAAGSLDISTGSASWTSPGQMNMYPGDSQTFALVLNNAGTLPLDWSATAVIDNESCFDVSIAPTSGSDLAAGGNAAVTATVSMPGAADNSCQLAAGVLTINVAATQV